MSRAEPQTRVTPRYLRFAQALALCGAITTESTACTACGACMCPGNTDAGFVGDAGGGPLPPGQPVCEGEAWSRCCAGRVLGPLAPPDLPA